MRNGQLIAIVVSGVVGGLIGYSIAKHYYLQVLDEEVSKLYNEYRKKSRGENLEKNLENEVDAIIRENNYATESKEVAEKEESVRREPEPAEEESIYLIDEEEYNDTHPEFEKVDIFYYQQDNTFCDAQEEIIADPQTILGNCYEVVISTEEEDDIFVRNEQIECDFFINIINAEYVIAIGLENKIYS